MLTTGNKSEMATGYCTLYGDMAGGFAVIKDVAKTLVYRSPTGATSRARNHPRAHHHAAAPAELRPDQKDQDSLPPYEVLDAILARYMEQDQSIAEIVAAGFERGGRRARHAAHQDQRVQTPPGAGRRAPDASRFWSGLALSRSRPSSAPNKLPRQLTRRQTHEADRCHHQTLQAR